MYEESPPGRHLRTVTLRTLDPRVPTATSRRILGRTDFVGLVGDLSLLSLDLALEGGLRVDDSRLGGLILGHELPGVRLLAADDLLPRLELERLRAVGMSERKVNTLSCQTIAEPN